VPLERELTQSLNRAQPLEFTLIINSKTYRYETELPSSHQAQFLVTLVRCWRRYMTGASSFLARPLPRSFLTDLLYAHRYRSIAERPRPRRLLGRHARSASGRSSSGSATTSSSSAAAATATTHLRHAAVFTADSATRTISQHRSPLRLGPVRVRPSPTKHRRLVLLPPFDLVLAPRLAQRARPPSCRRTACI